jgi:deoxyhypusine synthase
MGKKRPIDLSGVKTFSIRDRKHKVRVEDFARPDLYRRDGKLESLFPRLLRGGELLEVARCVGEARERKKPVIMAMGAHVIKCGLSPLITDLMESGLITAVVLNGSGAIHDYEVALIGETSEAVEEGLGSGAFGMVEETAVMMNDALSQHVSQETGMGAALGADICGRDLPFKEYSILACGHREGVPVTVHVALGTDTTHMHPSTDPAMLGRASYLDFRLLTSLITELGEGGCYFNVGSAVVLPEVFLKALTLARNLGHRVENFVTVNMDMVQHYRPLQNVVQRPTADGGKGYSLTGHHEVMLPLLYHLLMGQRGCD